MNHYDVVTLVHPLGDDEGFLLLDGKVVKHLPYVSGYYIKQILDVLDVKCNYHERNFKPAAVNLMLASIEDMADYDKSFELLWNDYDKCIEEILNGKFRSS